MSHFTPFVAFGAIFTCAVLMVIVWRNGWFAVIRRRPFEGLFLFALALGVTVVGGTKPVYPPDPPPVPYRTNVVLRLYYKCDNGHMYPIDALLREVQP